MDLRPHHLLCTQGYSGKGYSSEFVENMNQITRKLRSREPVKVRLTCPTDDLCAKCPNMLGTDLCSTNDKVKRFDRKVMEYFHLEEKEYIYQELVDAAGIRSARAGRKFWGRSGKQRDDSLCFF